LAQYRQPGSFRLGNAVRRCTPEGSEGLRRGRGSQFEMRKDLLDNDRIFDARDYLRVWGQSKNSKKRMGPA
jgi:hypothetical protein